MFSVLPRQLGVREVRLQREGNFADSEERIVGGGGGELKLLHSAHGCPLSMDGRNPHGIVPNISSQDVASGLSQDLPRPSLRSSLRLHYAGRLDTDSPPTYTKAKEPKNPHAGEVSPP